MLDAPDVVTRRWLGSLRRRSQRLARTDSIVMRVVMFRDVPAMGKAVAATFVQGEKVVILGRGPASWRRGQTNSRAAGVKGFQGSSAARSP